MEPMPPNPPYSTAMPPPSGFPPGPAQSGAPKVFGILSIIFASLGLLAGLSSSCMGMAGSMMGNLGNMPHGREMSDADAREVFQMIGTVYSAMGYQGLIVLLMSGFLLVVGVGQLGYRRWGAKLSVIWGAAALVALGGMVLIALLVIGPAYEEFFRKVTEQAARQGGKQPELPSGFFGTLMGGGSALFQVFFYAPYPILLLAFFTRPRVKAAMTR